MKAILKNIKFFVIGISALVILGVWVLIRFDSSKDFAWDAPNKRSSIISRSIRDTQATEPVWRSWMAHFKNALRAHDENHLRSLLEDAVGAKLSVRSTRSGPYEEMHWSATEANDSGDVVKYLLGFQAVKYSQFFFTGFHISEKARSAGHDPLGFSIQGDYQIVGVNKADGKSRVDRGFVRLDFQKRGRRWVVTSFIPYEIQTLLKTAAPSFEDETETILGENQHVTLRREAIRRGGYAISVGDINGDAYPDLFLGHSDRSDLYVNRRGEKLERVTSTSLSAVEKVKAAAFIDFDNRGVQDLVMTSFNPKDEGNNVRLFKNQSEGHFIEEKDFIKFKSPANYPMPLAVGNFNRDNLLDFYVGFPGSQDFTFMSHQVGFSRNLISHGIYENNGNHSFTDVSRDHKQLNHERRDLIFPHSSIAFDLTGNGLSDLLVIDDRDNLSPFYTSDEKTGFSLSSEKLGLNNSNYAMGAAVGDLNNDGFLDIAISYVNFHAADRFESLLSNSWSESVKTGFAGKGLVIYLNDGNNRFTNVTARALKYSLGEGVGNIEMFDYDNDGLLDIYVTNGLWTGESTKEVSSDFIAENLMGTSYGKAWNLKDRTTSKSQSDFMDSLVENKKHSFAGHQRNVLLRNNGDMTFSDVAPFENLDSDTDGYVVAFADLNNDGQQDVLLRNGDPAHAKADYKPVQIFMNKRSQDRVIRVQLIGRSVSKDAVGTKATLSAGGHQQIRQVIANNGAAQSERILHFGLGDAKLAERLQVEWTSGMRQTFENILPGTYRLIEGGQILCDSCLKVSER